MASPARIVTGPDDVFEAETGMTHRFRVTSNVMTISYLVDSEERSALEDLRFVLESSDGEYREERTPRDDLEAGADVLQLKFVDLLPGRTYTLTRHLSTAYSEVVFRDLPHSAIVDQHHAVNQEIADRRFVSVELGDAVATDGNADD